MYEYLVQKVTVNNPTDASGRLSALGAQGWDVKFGTVSGGSVILILQRPINAVRAGYQKAEAEKEKKEAKKKADKEKMAKVRAAKKSKGA